MPDDDVVVDKRALTIGTTMRLGAQHAHDGHTVLFGDPPLQTNHASDATHLKGYFSYTMISLLFEKGYGLGNAPKL
jgi:hypothetical protein